MVEQGAIQSRWSQLDTQRTTHLNRARLCAKLTIPHILPDQEDDHNTEYPTPYQSLGARAVNHLAAKLWLSLLPPNSTFFKLSLSPEVEAELEAAGQDIADSDIQAALSQIESAIVDTIDNRGMRTPSFKALRYLVVTGNCCVYKPDEDTDHHAWQSENRGLKVFRLDQYVVVRDPLGTMLEAVLREPVALQALPEDIQSQVAGNEGVKQTPEKVIPLYTQIKLEDDKYKVRQEAGGVLVPGSEGSYAKEELPWMFLRWSDEHDYGRGPVEDYLGDFMSLESLSQAIVEGSLAASKVVFLVNPNGVTRERNLSRARNCDFKPGVADDVSVLQVEKYHDFKVAAEQKKEIEQRLSFAFLLNTAIQRNAERVTAEEIRYMAEELEDALGGVYSVLAQEFQLPLVRLIYNQLVSEGLIPELPKNAVSPVITTGMEALGRNHDQSKLRTFIAELGQVLGPEMVAQYINAEEYIKRTATNYGVDMENLIRTNQQVQQMQQQQMMAEATQQATPGVAQEATKGAMQNGQNNQQ